MNNQFESAYAMLVRSEEKGRGILEIFVYAVLRVRRRLVDLSVRGRLSLSRDSTERVDTRVLQVIYWIEENNLPLFIGRQMDVFIDAGNQRGSMARNVPWPDHRSIAKPSPSRGET